MALEERFRETAENPFYSAAYIRFLNDRKLMGSKCKNCGWVSIPPKPICNKCQNDDMELLEMKGKGKLIAYTVIGVGAPIMVEEGFDRMHPYCSGVVELEEGPRILTRILGVDVKQPEKIKIGAPVRAEYVEALHGGESKVFLAFRVVS